ncbi:hypothetical protein D9M69_663240 [compost metagenome]
MRMARSAFNSQHPLFRQSASTSGTDMPRLAVCEIGLRARIVCGWRRDGDKWLSSCIKPYPCNAILPYRIVLAKDKIDAANAVDRMPP